ncbi:ABC transporter ATP-binding protein [Paraburkholderia sp. 40]|uniref:ABC transporter ATP-binding protein n=1 Tax=Paraburkholderia sp. 40 TaxID=2991059 RepID=UPI003D1D1839
MIETRALCVAFGPISVLEQVDVRAASGTVLGVVGHNGAGKTTLMRAIVGALPARSGQVRIDGQDVTTWTPQKRVALGLGYMPEDRRLIPELSVRANIVLPLEVARIDVAERGRRVSRVLDMIPELAPLIDRRGNQLSGGQQKLAALARAICQGQRLLLLDEPFEGVAPALVERLAAVLRALRQQGPTILVTDSEGANLQGLCDLRQTIERGRVRPDEISNHSNSEIFL